MKPANVRSATISLDLGPDQRLLESLVDRGVELLRACGGRGLCATCHVQVQGGGELLGARSEREERTLGRVSGVTANSRLACQARMKVAGRVTVALPSATYVTSQEDLAKLVGKRSKEPILHPEDGRVLIQGGKIITRTAILTLANTDFRISGLRDDS